ALSLDHRHGAEVGQAPPFLYEIADPPEGVEGLLELRGGLPHPPPGERGLAGFLQKHCLLPEGALGVRPAAEHLNPLRRRTVQENSLIGLGEELGERKGFPLLTVQQRLDRLESRPAILSHQLLQPHFAPGVRLTGLLQESRDFLLAGSRGGVHRQNECSRGHEGEQTAHPSHRSHGMTSKGMRSLCPPRNGGAVVGCEVDRRATQVRAPATRSSDAAIPNSDGICRSFRRTVTFFPLARNSFGTCRFTPASRERNSATPARHVPHS